MCHAARTNLAAPVNAARFRGVGGDISLYFLHRRMIGDRHNYSTRKKRGSEAASGRRVTGGCCLFSFEICIIAIMAARIELTVVTLFEMSRDSQG